MAEYKVLEAEKTGNLETFVAAKLNEGWSCAGGVSAFRSDDSLGQKRSGNKFLQAVQKTEAPPTPPTIFDFSTIENANYRMDIAGHFLTGFADNDPIDSISNEAPVGIAFTQDLDLSLRPTYIEAEVNTLAAIRGESGDYMRSGTSNFAGLVNGATSGTFFVVARINSVPSGQWVRGLFGVPASHELAILFDNTGGNSFVAAQVGGAETAANQRIVKDYVVGQWHIFEIHWDASDSNFRVDGGTESSTSTPVKSTTGRMGFLSSGALGVGGAKSVDADIAQMLYWNAQLSGANRDTVRTKLGEMYAVTLP